MASVSAALLSLPGCSAGPDEASALLPPVGVADGAKKDAATHAAARTAMSNAACETTGGAVSVETVLRQARTQGGAADTAATAPSTATAAAPCDPRKPAVSPVETGSLAPRRAAGPTATAVRAPGNAATAKPETSELFIDFPIDSLTISEQQKRMVLDGVAARMLGGQTRVRIVAARGGPGNRFEQLVVGQKRARAVKELLPARMVESIEFDPMLPEDTVRIEFLEKSATAN